MTVTTDDFENTQFADGVNVAFDFTFIALLAEFVVVVNITDAVTLTYGSDYSVELDDSGIGGTVTFVVAPDDGDEIHIYRLIQPFQLVNLIDEQDLDAETFEFVFDKLTILIQQQIENYDFLLGTTIPGLIDLINSILDLSGTVLGPGVSRNEGGIPVWTSAVAATLSSGILPTGINDVIKSTDGVTWTAGPNVVVSLGTLVVPGVTTNHGVMIWGDATGTTAKSTSAGTINQVFTSQGAGADPIFQSLLTTIGNLTNTAGHVLTGNGTGLAASFQALPATPVSTPSFFTATSSPRGLKYWSLSQPLAYAVGGNKARTTGSDSSVAGVRGLYNVLTTTTSLASYVQAYVTKADAITQRNALPIWLTRVLTGAAVTNQRIWAGLNKDDLTNMRNSGTPTKSTAAFRYDSTTDGTTWRCITCTSGGVVTATNSAITVSAATEYDLCVDMSQTGHVKFYIDGVLVANHTTNMPDATDLLDWFIVLKNTLAGTAHSLGMGPINLSHA